MINLEKIKEAKTLDDLSSYLQTITWKGHTINVNSQVLIYTSVAETLRKLQRTSYIPEWREFLTQLENMGFPQRDAIIEQLIGPPPVKHGEKNISYAEGKAILQLKLLRATECILFTASKQGKIAVGFSNQRITRLPLLDNEAFAAAVEGYDVRVITLQQAEEEYFSRRISGVAASALAEREATISKDNRIYTLILRNKIFSFKIAHNGLIEEATDDGRAVLGGQSFKTVHTLETHFKITHWR